MANGKVVEFRLRQLRITTLAPGWAQLPSFHYLAGFFWIYIDVVRCPEKTVEFLLRAIYRTESIFPDFDALFFQFSAILELGFNGQNIERSEPLEGGLHNLVLDPGGNDSLPMCFLLLPAIMCE